MRSRVIDGFDEADEEADGDDVVGRLCCCEAEGEKGPDEFAGGDPDGGPDFGEDDLGRDLADYVAWRVR